eukprot:TRINITY_DN248_c0_g1_i1.p1 TRINITY_DN248_c0_g1~~TRINITY_DN248_c0_g1_i1.p1  ORF type:complete len:700 (-),score=211.39 TRINITY_DN248_c0_g1_i1:3058-5157(-)
MERWLRSRLKSRDFEANQSLVCSEILGLIKSQCKKPDIEESLEKYISKEAANVLAGEIMDKWKRQRDIERDDKRRHRRRSRSRSRSRSPRRRSRSRSHSKHSRSRRYSRSQSKGRGNIRYSRSRSRSISPHSKDEKYFKKFKESDRNNESQAPRMDSEPPKLSKMELALQKHGVKQISQPQNVTRSNGKQTNSNESKAITSTVCVAMLPNDLLDLKVLTDHFSVFGAILHAQIRRDCNSAYIEFSSSREAQRALNSDMDVCGNGAVKVLSAKTNLHTKIREQKNELREQRRLHQQQQQQQQQQQAGGTPSPKKRMRPKSLGGSKIFSPNLKRRTPAPTPQKATPGSSKRPISDPNAPPLKRKAPTPVKMAASLSKRTTILNRKKELFKKTRDLLTKMITNQKACLAKFATAEDDETKSELKDKIKKMGENISEIRAKATKMANELKNASKVVPTITKFKSKPPRPTKPIQSKRVAKPFTAINVTDLPKVFCSESALRSHFTDFGTIQRIVCLEYSTEFAKQVWAIKYSSGVFASKAVEMNKDIESRIGSVELIKLKGEPLLKLLEKPEAKESAQQQQQQQQQPEKEDTDKPVLPKKIAPIPRTLVSISEDEGEGEGDITKTENEDEDAKENKTETDIESPEAEKPVEEEETKEELSNNSTNNDDNNNSNNSNNNDYIENNEESSELFFEDEEENLQFDL